MGKPPGYGEYDTHLQDMPFLHRITISSSHAPLPVAATALSYPELSSADVFEYSGNVLIHYPQFYFR